jgi:hypothetical protein
VTRSLPLIPRFAACLLLACVLSGAAAQTQPHPPYPDSPVIAGMHFDWTDLQRRAPGSDNWPMTWADDDKQYTVWGDGAGFGSGNWLYKVRLGVARIEGGAGDYTAHNVAGGFHAEHLAQVSGKSYGIISVNGVLYMWVGPGSGPDSYRESRLYRSPDHGASWRAAKWAFSGDDGFFLPTFLQFGRDNALARDDYVYSYAPHIETREWQVHRPGEIALMRAPAGALMQRDAWEFFAGTTPAGEPRWTRHSDERVPVFRDTVNGVMRTSAIFVPGLERYLLITEHSERARGNIGVYDAPTPWGPWTTAYFTTGFGAPHIAPTTFFWNLAPKWMGPEGRRFVLVFTGIDDNDAWLTVPGRFLLRAAPGG